MTPPLYIRLRLCSCGKVATGLVVERRGRAMHPYCAVLAAEAERDAERARADRLYEQNVHLAGRLGAQKERAARAEQVIRWLATTEFDRDFETVVKDAQHAARDLMAKAGR